MSSRFIRHSLKSGLDSGLWTLDSTLYMFCKEKFEGMGGWVGVRGVQYVDTGYMYFH